MAQLLPIIEEHAGVMNNLPNKVAIQDLDTTAETNVATVNITNPLEHCLAHNLASSIPIEADPIHHHYLPQPVVQPGNQQSVIAWYLQETFVGTAIQ